MPSSMGLSTLCEQLKNSLEGILVGSPAGIAFAPTQSSTEAILTITPTNSRAATVEITLDKEFGAYLRVGKASIFEIPFTGKRYTEADFIREITNLISGIVSSGFQEEVIISRGKIVGASGTINPGGRLHRVVSDAWMEVSMDSLRKKEREHHDYVPYS